MSHDGKKDTALTSENDIQVADVASGKVLQQLRGHKKWVSSMVFSADDKLLASVSEDNTVRLWEVATGRQICQIAVEYTRDSPISIAISPDAQTLATGGNDSSLRLWEVASGKEIRQLLGGHVPQERNRVWCVSYSPDGKTLASAGDDKIVRLWEVATGREIHQLPVPVNEGRTHSLAFSPDGKILVSAGDDKLVQMWEVLTGKRIAQLDGQQGKMLSVAFSPDGKMLASAGMDTTALVWRLVEAYGSGSSEPKLDPKQLESLWTDLAADDAAKAYQAAGTLILAANETMPFLQKRLRPASPRDAERIARLLADLDKDEFAVREKASQELEQLGELVRPALQKALTGQPSAEVRQRVETLLAKLSTPAPEHLRIQRAVMVLEQIGTPEARQLLETLSKGAEGALLTEESRAALKRIKP